MLDYPGGLMIATTKVTASTEGEGKYKVTYDLKLTGENGTQTDVNWYLFRAGDGKGVQNLQAPGCKLQIDSNGNTSKYYYTNDGGDTCGPKGYIESKFSDLQLVAKGTLAKQSGAGTEATVVPGAMEDITITKGTPEGLAKHTLYTTAGAGKYTSEYYYLVVEYPNKQDQDASEGNQNADMGQKISLSISSIENIVTEVDATE